MTKISTRTRGITSRAEFDEKVNEVAQLDVELRQLSTQMDAELQTVRDKYAARLESKGNYRDALFHACDSYASKHQGEVLTPGMRSGETALARYGFRLGNPTLVLLSRKHKWEGVLAAICAKGEEWVAKYITHPAPKANKDALKTGLSDEELAGLGCRIEQTDAFWLEPKDDNIPQN